MPHCKIHNVGFYSPEPNALYSMALQKTEGKLAVARSDASIEIWNLNYLPFIERTIPSSLENFSIEGLVWCGSRLFSVGLHGWLIEYDLYSLTIKDKRLITGEAGTCLDSIKTHLAVGTEQGYINLFRVTEDGAEFEKFLDKQEGRILCLKFSATGEFVVAGSINAVRIWNVKSGHAIHKMVLGRSEAKRDTVVWCLEVMNDFTIFSGDSRGVLTLWDGRIGAQMESYQSHKADITAICLDEEQQSVYCAGVDPLISNYERVKIGSNIKWVKSVQRKIHDHDVRALVFHNGKLYSAGVDSYLVCSYHPPKTLIKYAPILQSPCVQIAPKPRFILLRHSKHIEVWSLGYAKEKSESYRGMLELKTKPKKLLVLQKLGKNWADEDEAEGIVCSCISANGEWIFVGTSTGFRLYQLQMVNNKPKLTRIDDLDDSNVSCVQGIFNDVHNELIVALSNGSIIVYELEMGNPFITQRIEPDKEYLTDTLSIITVSPCGKHLIVADNKSNIVIFDHTPEVDGYFFCLKLPRYEAPPTALGINPLTYCIVVAYADNKVKEYDMTTQKFTSFSKQLENSSNWKLKTHAIRSISFDSRHENIVFMHDDSNLIIVNKDAISTTSSSKSKMTKASKRNSLTNGYSDSLETFGVHSIQKYKHLVHIAALSGTELVAVEVNPLSILEKLPPAFAQKTFGTK